MGGFISKISRPSLPQPSPPPCLGPPPSRSAPAGDLDPSTSRKLTGLSPAQLWLSIVGTANGQLVQHVCLHLDSRVLELRDAIFFALFNPFFSQPPARALKLENA